MDKKYLIFKCSKGQGKQPIACVTGYDLDEAHEALKWLRNRHAEEEKYKLGEGEFFEVLEEGHFTPEEWREATAGLRRAGG